MASLPDEIDGALALDCAEAFGPYQEAACSILQRDLLRKLIPKDSFDADIAAEYSFHMANAKCREFKLKAEWEIDRVVFGETKMLLDRFFHPGSSLLVESFDDLFYNGRLGPGVNLGSSHTSQYGKLWSSPLTCTSEMLYNEYNSRVKALPMWAHAESVRSSHYGDPLLVQGSRTIFVPKTSQTSRLICSEPTVNMYFQLGFAQLLESRLRSFFGIDLALQPTVNQQLARIGSIDGSYTTIDLTSASDSISMELARELLPDWVYDLIGMLRSPATELRSDVVPLYMVSTMGCGFTFPLQTIIFACISKACQNVFGKYGQAQLVAVFGDDIVCPSWAHDYVIKYLRKFGFEPNPSKTFSEGGFRESCGADWLYGQPVRPVFIKTLETAQDRVVAINALNEWSAYTGVTLRRVVQCILKSIPARFRNRIPFGDAKDAGIRVPLRFSTAPLDMNGSRRFISWVPAKVSLRFKDDGSFSGPQSVIRKTKYNPHGLFLCALYGEVKSMSIMLRQKQVRYRTKRRVCPNWDYMWRTNLINGVRITGQQWETAVESNLIFDSSLH